MLFDEGIVGYALRFVRFECFEAHSVNFVVGGYGGDEMAGGEDVERGEDNAVYL
jgi:hypothetical protein